MKTRKVIGGLLLAGAAVTAATYMLRRKIPRGVEAFEPFEIEKYLGKWYEVARMDFNWERGLTECTAEYSLNGDGSVHVLNRGYDLFHDRWSTAEGKARFVHSPETGMLEVSFFGPFYSGYNVIDVDADYRYALVFGRNLNYMWILSRDGSIPEEVLADYLLQAEDAGYDTDRLVWTLYQ